MEYRIRLIDPSDARRLARLRTKNRDYQARWDPVREDSFFTEDGQRGAIVALLERHKRDETAPMVILNGIQEVVGQLTLSQIVRGPFQSCSMGYWVDQAYTNQGIATSAVNAALSLAFTRMGLHRIDASVMPANVASHKVLQKNGFRAYGMAPRYLKIAGRWEDHILLQKLADDHPCDTTGAEE